MLTREELEAFVAMSNDNAAGPLHPSMRGWTTALLDATWPAADGAAGLQPALSRLCQAASAAADDGAAFVVLSDREAGPERVAIPPLAALGAVHHHLIGLQKRSRVGLIVDAAEPREVHHFCCLLGYGADAVCPSLALEALSRSQGRRAHAAQGLRGGDRRKIHQGDQRRGAEGERKGFRGSGGERERREKKRSSGCGGGGEEKSRGEKS